jgi:hypothetical protein
MLLECFVWPDAKFKHVFELHKAGESGGYWMRPTLRPQCERMMDGLISLGTQQDASSCVTSLHSSTNSIL